MSNPFISGSEGSERVHRVDFEPLGRRAECLDGQSVLACAQRLGLGISSVCGGLGRCHTCRVQVLSGEVSPPTRAEQDAFSHQELTEGWRLSCETYPASHCKVRVPAESMTTPQRIATEGLETDFPVDPVVQSYQLELPPPSLSHPVDDAHRLMAALTQQYDAGCGRIDIEVLRVLSPTVRTWNRRFQAVVRDDEVVALLHRDTRQLGLAIDVGTTKIAGYLVDLRTAQTLAAEGVMNPQIGYGEDVISRITAITRSPEKAALLQKLALKAINELAATLCARSNQSAADIVEAAVVCNTAMHHILLRLPVDQLAMSPYVPAVTSAMDIKARDMGLDISSGAYVHVLPNIAGFVGADHVAMLLSTQAADTEGPLIAMDIGTNTEVSLARDGRITAASCASGPAFEGGHIKDGMRAAPGAIERIWIEEDAIRYETIGDLPPVGICGSGILDAMAQLYTARIIDRRGRMIEDHPRVRRRGNQREFVLVSEDEREGKPSIVITQNDIRELQLAKAAIRTGIQLLLETNDCKDEELTRIIIAGAFGTYINVASAVAIGLLPSLPYDRFRQVGNAAGMGARLALLSRTKRAEARSLATRVNYLELATAPDFSRTFLQASYLGRYGIRDSRRQTMDEAKQTT